MISFIKKHSVIFAFLGCGIFIRLIFAFSFNHTFDFFNIIAIVKSEAETDSSLPAFFAIKQVHQHDTQLFGKIYYQFLGLWFRFLDVIGLINLQYIFGSEPFNGTAGYMSGFGKWGPQHYQLVSIKMIQFFFETLFLGFFLGIVKIIVPKSIGAIRASVAFWAFTPFLIYPSFVPFQSDLAMTAFLLGGIFFGLKAYGEKDEKKAVLFIVLMSCMFAVGAIIKQVPLLFVIPFAIVISRNWKMGIASLLGFGLSYYLISQPWSHDAKLYKQLFLLSTESTALFHFTLNGASIFLVLYLCIVVGVVAYRQKIQEHSINIIKLAALILAVIYISEDIGYLYAQFTLWILPILFLLTLKDRIYSVFFLAPILGFYRWIIIDNGASVGSMGITFGKALEAIPSFEYVLQQFFSYSLIHTAINSAFIGLFILLIVVLTGKRIHLPWIEYVTPGRVVTALFGIYLLFFLFDYSQRGSIVQITTNVYSETRSSFLTKNPLEFTVQNPQARAVTGIDVSIMSKKKITGDTILLVVLDKKGVKVDSIEVNKFTLPESFDEVLFKFHKPIRAQEFTVHISDPFEQNDVSIQSAGVFNAKYQAPYQDYDQFYKNNKTHISFGDQIIVSNVRGRYELADMIDNVKYHISQKPSFYIAYGILLGLLFIASAALFRYSFWNNKP